jgi:hypothetical protein
MQNVRRYFSTVEVSRPETPLHMLWSLLIAVIVLYFLTEAILVAFFTDSRQYIRNHFTDPYSILLILLIANILVTVNRGVYVKGVLKLDRSTVTRHYLKCGVYVDVASLLVLALSIYMPYNWAAYLRLSIIVRLSDISYFDRLFFRSIHTHRNLKQLYLLFKLILAILFISHLFGCIFFYLDISLIHSGYYG